ncbi:PdxA family dehydrogenase [Rhodococcus opacus]|uniref:PdxA family dehydrogenase n=1 Tax=Rhodococcus opacus TaxID=37919 RepID=UPI0002A45B97|nr:4-hydroxythreonine-4-phosphate dehydrogenase PdxA [Rhodococcus opacus]ELB91384.1 4-hydroxythreonine-4-phosphate dehydrogenase [Rhodococcus wratislaviensis IFP 2016]MDX5967671.1 4-hydroxythreonine-4-phosphate dehydrogenase PdxA [Rhodococcus opacus]NKY76484.1 4-hydroxythreonine-4-phosphate dehydrogenase PdxA [Rhodococcus opacus]UNM99018.1 4-hydroxythreonine-4-phosphate dehydrogenase PdxA [Rhodococcus opacus]WKN55388.1 4-hydroxythreonine-4-phosphate dehydrogenase PdxA [Rhodococcus opacus]
MSGSPPRVLLTIGDPNGIGPELAVKAVMAAQEHPAFNPVLVGDRCVVEPLARWAGMTVRETADGLATPVTDVVDLLPVHSLPAGAFAPGRVTAEAGKATVAYLERAVRCLQGGGACGIVACPHSETAVNAAGISFDGYPSLLAELVGARPDQVFLMLIGAGLRIVHATLHESLRDALRRLTPELVHGAARAAVETLQAQGIPSPRIGVFGINPHAGEGGLFGDEDLRVTAPAVERLRAAGIDASGPVGADLMLADPGFDAFVAMYHDQGHIPVKLLAGRSAAAMTIGAGVRFSSVGHGAGFDIAGKGTADPDAVVGALRLIGAAETHMSAPGTFGATS